MKGMIIMSEKMNLNQFREIFENKGFLEAIKYKDNFIPKSLFKYYSLFDENYTNYREKNKLKLNSIIENKLWCSNYNYFNDPFEFKMIALDKEKLNEANWDVEYIEKFLDQFKERTIVSCFCSEVDNNMPMWAHYANNHQGFCVKYSILNPRTIFPVQYEPKRSKCAVIPTMIISEIMKAYDKKLRQPTEKFYEYFTYLYMSFCCKHDFWKYENEFRLLYQNIDVVDGKNISLSEVGLKIEAIYIGYKCESSYKKELMDIASCLGCEVYKMGFDEYGEEFKLETKKLTING